MSYQPDRPNSVARLRGGYGAEFREGRSISVNTERVRADLAQPIQVETIRDFRIKMRHEPRRAREAVIAMALLLSTAVLGAAMLISTYPMPRPFSDVDRVVLPLRYPTGYFLDDTP